MTKHNQNDIIKNCISNGQMANANRMTNNRKFNLTDFYYILHRSIKSSIIREWHSQLFKCFCLFFLVFYFMTIYPNDIGSDPSCSLDVNNEINLTKLTGQIYDVINGKRTKAELNINYLVALVFAFGIIYAIYMAFVFPDQIKVSKVTIDFNWCYILLSTTIIFIFFKNHLLVNK